MNRNEFLADFGEGRPKFRVTTTVDIEWLPTSTPSVIAPLQNLIPSANLTLRPDVQADIPTGGAPVPNWFGHLLGMHSHLKGANTQTPPNLKGFSKKKLSDLLKTAAQQDEFATFCHLVLKLPVDANYVKEKQASTFRQFTDDVFTPVTNALLQEFLNVAILHDGNLTILTIGGKTLGDAFGSGTFPDNPIANKMHQRLLSIVPPEFYPPSGALLKDTSKTVRQTIAAIMD